MEQNNQTNNQTANEQAQVLNPVVEIAGLGSRDSACEHLRQILSGYSQFAAWRNNQGATNKVLEDDVYNIEVIADLLRYALCGKLPQEK